MAYKAPLGDPDVLQRRPGTDKRYTHVQPVVDTGLTAELVDFMKEASRADKNKIGENFRRVRPATVQTYITFQRLKREQHLAQREGEAREEASASLDHTAPTVGPSTREGGQCGSSAKGGRAEALESQRGPQAPTQRSPPHSNVESSSQYLHPMDAYHGGVGGMAPPPVTLLLVDVRQKEDYDACHLHGAIHYDKMRLSHSLHPFTPAIYAVKNKSDTLVVLYDYAEEEVIGDKVACRLFEKGIDNLAVLSGGMKLLLQLAQEEAPEPGQDSSIEAKMRKYVDGETIIKVPQREQRVARLAKRSDAASQTSLAQSQIRSTITNKPKGLSSSLAKSAYTSSHR